MAIDTSKMSLGELMEIRNELIQFRDSEVDRIHKRYEFVLNFIDQRIDSKSKPRRAGTKRKAK